MAQQYVYTMHRLTQGVPARPGGARGRLALLPPRGEDRRARLQRRRQVDAAADHGRARHRVPRRRAARARRDGRAARAGARSSTRPRTCAATSRTAWPRRARCSTASTSSSTNYSDETADEFARLQEQIDAVDGWNLDTHARDRDGRAAPAAAATPTSRSSRAASAAASRCAGCCCASPTCCCSTSPPTTSTPSRWRGWSATCRTTRARSSRSPTTATSSTTSPAGSSSSTAARGIPFKGNYSGWLEQKQARLAQEEKQESARRRTIDQELEWVRMNAERAPQQAQGAPEQLRARCSPRTATSSSTRSRSTSRPARGWATSWSRPRACARATATGC